MSTKDEMKKLMLKREMLQMEKDDILDKAKKIDEEIDSIDVELKKLKRMIFEEEVNKYYDNAKERKL